MEYLWLFLGALAVVCVVALSMSLLVRYVSRSMPLSSPVFPTGGIVLTAAYFLSSIPLWIDGDLVLPFAGFLILCGFLFLQLRATGFLKEVGFLALCLAACSLMPTNLYLFDVLGPEWTYPVLAASLYLMMRLFMIMDRVPWFSNLTLIAQGLLILFLFQRGMFPKPLGYPLFFAFAATIAVAQTVKVYFGQPVLGEFASLIAGFALGSVWTFVIAKGFWALPPVLYSYSALEVLISFVLSCIAVRGLSLPTKPFFIEQAFATDLNPKRLVRALFFVLIFLSLFALVNLSPGMGQNILILLALLLFATCFQFKRWAVPRVRFRDLGSDLKQGFSELKKEMMTVPLKKNAPKKGKKK